MKLLVAIALVAVTLVGVECAKGPLVTDIVCGRYTISICVLMHPLGIL